MPILNVYVSDATLDILTEYGQRHGNTVDDLASAAVEDAAIRAVPPQARRAAYDMPPVTGPVLQPLK